MRALTLLLVVSSYPAMGQPAQLKLVLPSVSVSGMGADRAEFFTEHLGGALSSAGADVTTPRQIEQILGVERQRQLLGCSDTSSCMVELSSALGSDALVSSEIAQFEGVLQVNVKLIDSAGKVRFSQQARTPTVEELLSRIDAIAVEAANAGASSLGRSLKPLRRSGPWLPLSITALALGVGSEVAAVVLLLRSNELARTLRGPGPIDLDTAAGWAAEGKQSNTIGVALAIGGGALLAAGGVFLGLEFASRPSIAIVPMHGGAQAVLSSTWE
jgi:hypothetical protein